MSAGAQERMPWSRLDRVALACLTLAAGAIRFIRLTTPGSLIGDERFYVNDACRYLYSAVDACVNPVEANLEHPPLGKWIIAAGIRMFGDTQFGHRFWLAVLGTLTIPLVYLLARRLLGSRLGAAVAAGLMAFDFLHFVMSRTAMLDVPLTFFALLSFLALAVARDRPEAADLRWRLAAGAAAGAAIASKWTGVTVLGTILFLAVAWDVFARRGPDERHPVVRAIRQRGLGWLLAFAVVPAAVYSLTFIGRVHGDVLALPWSESSWWSALWERQLTTFRFHAHHIWSHRFASEPWSWPLTKRGFRMDGRILDDGSAKLVIATGNPVVWTAGVLACLYVGVRWIRSRSVRSAEGFIVAGFALTYLPWFLYFYAPFVFFTWGRVATFIFYLLPTIPALYLALGYVAARVGSSRAGRAVVAATALFVVGAFAFYYPILASVRLDEAALRPRLFAFDNCAPPDHDPAVFLQPSTNEAGETVFTEMTAPPEVFLPPEGWCWV